MNEGNVAAFSRPKQVVPGLFQDIAEIVVGSLKFDRCGVVADFLEQLMQLFLSFLYAVCITLALRAAPLFPRMLVYAWLCDVMMQLAIAHYAASVGGMPGELAISLQSYLTANIQKVLISVVIWLPYLLMSARVNVTFRNRIRFAPA